MNYFQYAPVYDVTAIVKWEEPRGVQLPLLVCVCGARHAPGTVLLVDDVPRVMPCCGRRLQWRPSVAVFESAADPRRKT